MILRSAFQAKAFQFTGFQEAGQALGAGWTWHEYFRSREAYRRRKQRERDEQSRPVPEVLVPVIARAPSPIIARPVYTDLSGLAARLSPPNPAREMEEFRAFMEWLDGLEALPVAPRRAVPIGDGEMGEFHAFMQTVLNVEERV